MTSTIIVRIKRQEGPGQPAHWDEFHVPRRASANVISVLMEIQRNPKTSDGRAVPPPSWDAACLEEVCGSCTMLINGRVRQACSALIDQLEEPLRLEPMTKFPLVRDLCVDRQRMFEALKRVRAWIPVDGTYDLGPGPRQASAQQEVNYVLSTCMTCGCCLEVCPQINSASDFIGAAAVSQVRLFNEHPTGKLNAEERLRALAAPGGVGDCGKAANCVQVCPKEIPLTSSIAEMSREATRQAIKDWLVRDERKSHGGPA